MTKKYYYAKDVTCPDCEGLGFLRDLEGCYPIYNIELINRKIDESEGEMLEFWKKQKEWYYEEHHCYNCDGKGWVHDEVDENGFTIINIHVEDGECE